MENLSKSSQVINDYVHLLTGTILNILYNEHKHIPCSSVGLRTKTEERKKSRYKGENRSTVVLYKAKY
jgi:hypothetical protein